MTTNKYVCVCMCVCFRLLSLHLTPPPSTLCSGRWWRNSLLSCRLRFGAGRRSDGWGTRSWWSVRGSHTWTSAWLRLTSHCYIRVWRSRTEEPRSTGLHHITLTQRCQTFNLPRQNRTWRTCCGLFPQVQSDRSTVVLPGPLLCRAEQEHTAGTAAPSTWDPVRDVVVSWSEEPGGFTGTSAEQWRWGTNLLINLLNLALKIFYIWGSAFEQSYRQPPGGGMLDRRF